MYYAYVLQSQKDKRLYIGSTVDLKRRIKEHNEGKNFSTKSRVPLKLLFYEALPTLEEAVEREKFYKSGRGHEVLHKILFKTLLNFSRKSERLPDEGEPSDLEGEVAKVVTAGV